MMHAAFTLFIIISLFDQVLFLYYLSLLGSLAAAMLL